MRATAGRWWVTQQGQAAEARPVTRPAWEFWPGKLEGPPGSGWWIQGRGAALAPSVSSGPGSWRLTGVPAWPGRGRGQEDENNVEWEPEDYDDDDEDNDDNDDEEEDEASMAAGSKGSGTCPPPPQGGGPRPSFLTQAWGPRSARVCEADREPPTRAAVRFLRLGGEGEAPPVLSPPWPRGLTIQSRAPTEGATAGRSNGVGQTD